MDDKHFLGFLEKLTSALGCEIPIPTEQKVVEEQKVVSGTSSYINDLESFDKSTEAENIQTVEDTQINDLSILKENILKEAHRISQINSGGGNNAKNFASGGTMNGALVVNGSLSVESITPQLSGGLNLPNSGFIDYNDTSTSSGLTLSADTWTSIPNDGLGAFSNDTYAPINVTQLIDTTTGKIDPRQLNLGDTILIRNDFTVTPHTNNTSLKMRYELGDGAGLYYLTKRLGRLDEGSNQPYNFSLGVDLIYMGDSNTNNNLIDLQLNLSSKGSVVNNGSVIQVIRYKI